ncbi:MAG TPA: hypothetical protein VFK05_24005 [Polyangiaceae bacterium]|nr:hypothetical protein [Polyangiaceae bacterium]
MSARTGLSFVLLVGAVLATSRAGAQSLAPHQAHAQASLGLRVSGVPDSGYDAFSDSDSLAQVSLGLSATVYRHQRFSLAAAGYWDYGQKSSTARSSDTELDVHRLSIGPEARYHLLPPLYVFVNALPAFAHSSASLEDGVAQVTRYARHWAYGVDLAGGAAFEVYGGRDEAALRPRLWVMAQGGYGFMSSTSLEMSPDSGQGPQRPAPIDLGSLSLAGPYLRLSAVVGF